MSILAKLNETKLPLGTSDFAKIIDDKFYYTDKSLFIKDFLDSKSEVTLFTRPRRFGKTLNMSMLKTFFEKPLDGKDTSHYFKNLKIWQAGEKYRAEQGKRPVIYLTFKDIKTLDFGQALSKIRMAVFSELDRHGEIFESDKFTPLQKIRAQELLDNLNDISVLSESIKTLSFLLHKHYGEKPLVLIDEYDVPIQSGYSCGYYKEIVMFMRDFMSGAFKDNSSLYMGAITGVTRVSKESIFSGLNNIDVDTVFSRRFSQYFGFTKQEAAEMFRFYGAGDDKLKEAEDWYDGYIFGETEIYNPWSLLSYLKEDCVAETYWVNMSTNELAKDCISRLDSEDKDSLSSLISGEKANVSIASNIIYPELGQTLEQAYGLLAQAGYLKTSNARPSDGEYICDIAIPNRELSSVYASEIINRIIKAESRKPAKDIRRAIVNGDSSSLQKYLSDFLAGMCSSLDLTAEKDYQNLMMGLFASMRRGYYITANREAGLGRADIIIKPRLDNRECSDLPGIVLELKHYKAKAAEKRSARKMRLILEQKAEEALRQIDEKSYVADLKEAGCKSVIKYGASFSGKFVCVKTEI